MLEMYKATLKLRSKVVYYGAVLANLKKQGDL